MTTNKNRMRLAFAELTQGRNVTIEGRLLFEAGYMAGQKAMQERCISSLANDPDTRTWLEDVAAINALEIP